MPISELLKLYDIDQSEIGVREEGKEDVMEQEETYSSDEGYCCLPVLNCAVIVMQW